MMGDEEELPCIMGNSSKASTMADGSLRLQIDIRPDDAQRAFKLFGTPNSAVALARLTDEVAVEEERPGKKKKGPFGESARALVQSGFFRTPNIWAGIGPDSEFLEWLKHQKSALSGKRDYYEDTFEGCCVPAHVRHLEHGGGTGIKPEYSAIPLTNEEHQLAHQKGDSALGEREWWDKMRIKYVSQWAYETLKEKMGYDSYTDIAPYAIRAWAKQRELENLLPKSFHVQSTESTPEGEA